MDKKGLIPSLQYNGEKIWTPKLETSGRVRSWDNGEVKLQSLHANHDFEEKYTDTPTLQGDVSWRERCLRMVEVFPNGDPNVTHHLFLATQNLVTGDYLGDCPFRSYLKCKWRPPALIGLPP